MQCPVDGETLVMSERSGVEIDYCPKCRGVWLDRGELDKIVARASGDEQRPVVMQAPGGPAIDPTLQPPAHPTAAPMLQGAPQFPTGDRGRDDRRRDDDDRRRDDDDRYRTERRRDDDDRRRDHDDRGYRADDRDYRRDDDDYEYRGKKKKRESFLSDLFDF
ncbi:zf-TFIIB domain-containing protein [Paracoccus luteus]|uniref:TFIIB-type zinc ribbon-containing protein n=1 Tax=Paracoccus luteus TaxID=2508543 RepID=UPI00106F3D20